MAKTRNGPEPVSCQSCRAKKLKCDQVRPCSNCSARGITCVFIGTAAGQRQINDGTTDSIVLQERVKRLEAMLLTPGSDIGRQVRASRRNDSAISTPASLPSAHAQSRVRDYSALEDVATREDTVLPTLSTGIEFEVSDMHEILEPQIHLSRSQLKQNSTTLLPDFATATELLRSYECNVDHVYRILHIPTVRTFMKTLYLRLSQAEDVPPSQAALLLSIFAFAVLFYQPPSSSDVQFLKVEGSRAAKVFSKAALDVLDHTRRNTSCTIEDLQAHVLMSMLTFQLDGFSARGRILFSTAVAIARDLRLHQLDSVAGSPAREARSVRAQIDLEVKRRVFWYIASTDWLLAAVSGPQEGIYSIQSKHIQVHLPKDCTDDELPLLDDEQSSVDNQTSGITYLLERVKLAHLCREMVDLIPLHVMDTPDIPYDHVITLDERLTGFVSALPVPFKTDAESRALTKPLEALNPALPLLRYSINQAAHSRRCRLHQRYLFRQSEDPRYSFSRRACLDSARAVIQSDLDLVCPDPPWVASARRGIATHFKHLATVLLIMDLCFNPNQPDTEEVKVDVRNILTRFHAAKHVSPLLARFLDSIHNILRKHDIDLTSPGDLSIDQSQLSIHVPPGFDVLAPTDADNVSSADNVDAPFSTSSIDELWPFLYEEEQIDLTLWDEFFSFLDSQPL